MQNSESLGDYLKKFEKQLDSILSAKNYLYCRLDGKAFHTLTRGMNKPFDNRLINTIDETCKVFFQRISPCPCIIYTQSDEISFLFKPVDDGQTSYAGYRTQKLTSIFASMFAAEFVKQYYIHFGEFTNKAISFDARLVSFQNFDDVVKMFYWREKDCYKNSVSMLSQSMFNDKELFGKNTDQKIQMLGDHWVNLDPYLKYGRYFIKEVVDVLVDNELKMKLESVSGKPAPTTVKRNVIKKLFLTHSNMNQFKIDFGEIIK